MKYEILLVDVPWRYNDRKLVRKDGKKAKRGIGSVNIYDCLSVEELCALPIQNICADNCIMFFWATYPLLPDALKVLETWGFVYKTIGFNWVKVTKTGKPFFGCGYYAASNTEPCLLATRGKVIKPASNSVSSLVIAPHPRSILTGKIIHSAKPNEIRERISEMYPTQKKIELFARSKHFIGWDATGLEYDGRDIGDFLYGKKVKQIPQELLKKCFLECGTISDPDIILVKEKEKKI